MRQLIPLRRIAGEVEERGEDLDSLFIDRSDIVEIVEDTEAD
jgi:hypothetical protein